MIRSRKKEMREIRHRRVRLGLKGNPSRPRLSVYRSGKHIHAQLIDDIAGRTLVAVSSLSPELKSDVKSKKTERATKVGELLARKALEQKIEKVVLDRGPFKYHGRVKALAEAARSGGLQF
ncbi:MAG: 50S ribosomal protein L18 [Deltaproteobacteria bacterium]|nr:50S ribosomal protein L18 [Deltaproteobacteria bacterium]